MTEAKYRKKPVTVHAFQYNGDLIDSDGKPIVPAWAIEAYNSGIMYYDSVDDNTPPVELYISTLEGVHHAPVGVNAGLNCSSNRRLFLSGAGLSCHRRRR